MTSEPFDPDLETVTAVKLSPVAKSALLFIAGAACGIVIGLGVSTLLAETKAEAPHVPTRVHEDDAHTDAFRRYAETKAESGGVLDKILDTVDDAVVDIDEVVSETVAEQAARLGIDLDAEA
jgi:hypothetical protein